MDGAPDPKAAAGRTGGGAPRHAEAITIRPLGPSDRSAYRAFAEQLTPEDLRLRFGQPVVVGQSDHCTRLLDPDPRIETVFAALDDTGAIRGVARLVRLPPDGGDIALIVRSDSKRSGLGLRLLRHLVEQARAGGLRQLRGDVLGENHAMLRLVEKLGFRRTGFNGSLIEIGLVLEPAPVRPR